MRVFGMAGDEKRYAAIKLALSLAGTAADFAVIALFAFGGFSVPLHESIARMAANPYAQFLIFIAIIGLAASAVGFPLDFLGSYVVEHRYNLSNQSVVRWAWEKCKSAAVGIAIGLPLSLLFFFFLRLAGNLWWLWFGCITVFVAVILARIAPVVIFPLFYRFTRLEEGEIAGLITELLEKQSVAFEGIYTFNMSRDTKKANAGFTGFGKGKRILLSDTLVQDFTPAEIAVIFSHELGHYKKMHLWKGLAATSGAIMSSFFLCGQAYAATIRAMGFSGVDDIPAIPVLFLFLSVFGFLIMPFTNALSRRHERQADRFALEASGDAASFISSMERLASMNLADRDPHPAVEFLFHSHPSIAKRIAFAGSRMRTQP